MIDRFVKIIVEVKKKQKYCARQAHGTAGARAAAPRRRGGGDAQLLSLPRSTLLLLVQAN